MLCSLNGLEETSPDSSEAVSLFFFFFQGTSWPLWSHDETLEKLSAICTAGWPSHDNKLRGQKCRRPSASDSLTENNKPTRVPAQCELRFFWVLGGLHESLQVFNVTQTIKRSFPALLTAYCARV